MTAPIAQTERNELVVKELIENTSTVGQLALRYGVSRERITQIYYRATGQIKGSLLLIKRERIKVKKHLKNKSVKFICANCGKDVSFNEGKNKRKYCSRCHQKSQIQQRDMGLIFRCKVCKQKFHPYRSKRTFAKYCSRKCYYKRVPDLI